MTAPPMPPQSAPVETPAPNRGFYLDEPDEEKAAQRAERDWKKNSGQHRLNAAEWKRHQWWRDGRQFVQIDKAQDLASIKLVQPMGVEHLPAIPHRGDELIRNAVAIFIADPPRPEAEPSRDTPAARDAAKASTRFLTYQLAESGLNTDGVYESAINLAGTYGSSFVWVCHDPKGGGLQPLSIDASPDAMTEADALDGPGPLESRFVKQDGTLAEEATDTKKVFLPKLSLHILTGNHIRFLPRVCNGVSDCDGLIITTFLPLSTLQGRYPKVAAMNPTQLWELVNWRIHEYQRLVPDHTELDRGRQPEDGNTTDQAPDPDTMVCVQVVFYRSGYEYSHGCYAVFGGGKYRLHAETMEQQMPAGDDQMQDELLDIPVAQFTWAREPNNPYGLAPMRQLGPLGEQAASIFVSQLEYLYKFGKQRLFLPLGSPVQPEDMADPEKPIYFAPNGKPEWAPIPDYPQFAQQSLETIWRTMEQTIGVTGPAMGQIAGSVRSAEQQKTMIEQATVAISAPRANFEDGYERLHRIILQQIRAHYTMPQLAKYLGDDGSYQLYEFNRMALGDTSQVRIRRGSGTGLAPTAKNDLLMQQLQMGIIDPEEAKRLTRDNMSPMLGMEDSPHVKRIRRQIQAWNKGPPPELEGAEPEIQTGPDGLPMVDPMTGQPVMLDPVAQAAAQLFPILPVDEEQMVAILHHQELHRVLPDIEQQGFPPAWNDALIQRYLFARQAAGVLTLAEQQMMAQQQQAAATEQAEGEKADTRQREDEVAERDSQAEMNREQMKLAAQAAGAP